MQIDIKLVRMTDWTYKDSVYLFFTLVIVICLIQNLPSFALLFFSLLLNSFFLNQEYSTNSQLINLFKQLSKVRFLDLGWDMVVIERIWNMVGIKTFRLLYLMLYSYFIFRYNCCCYWTPCFDQKGPMK